MIYYDLVISIVLYKSNIEMVRKTINSFSNLGLKFKLVLSDNSPDDSLKSLEGISPFIEYQFNEGNLGFGKAHNKVIRKYINCSKYHLVLNPDVYFDKDTLEFLVNYLEINSDVGQVMPKVLYPNGDIQYLCKLLPTPLDLFLRRFFPSFPGASHRNDLYELRKTGYNRRINVPYLSGCFMLLRNSVLKEVGLFDERIFMYIEDADLSRRIHKEYRTMYIPDVHITHHYEKGSYKNFKLMLYNIHGAYIYFSKWGWFIDKERRRINSRVLNE
ncbi:MAG: glycosyltransferase family 2 protein [Bacteroidota bacterium]